MFVNEHFVIRMDQTRVLNISVGAGRRQKFGTEKIEMAGRLRAALLKLFSSGDHFH